MTNRLGLTGVSILLVFAALAGCGGGGGGGGGGSTPAATGFTKTVVMPDAPSGGSAGDWNGLFSASAGSNRYQALVRAQDIQGSGALRSLALRFGAVSTGNSCPNVTIKLVHRGVGAAALSTTFASNLTSGRGAPVTVFGPATLTIPAGASGDYFAVPLSGAFNYNGVDNLIVDIESDVCTATTVLDAHDANPVYTALIWNVDDRTAPTGAAWNSLADMMFTFAGGDNRVQSPGSFSTNIFPFGSFAGGAKVQLLYYPAEIDGTGPITGIAFPVSAVTTAQSHTVTVKLGHSTLTDLTTTFANNFNLGTPVIVANAVTFEIPAGAPAGRHLWVPLPDGVFNYNGTDNLIVEIEASASAGSTSVTTHQAGLNQRRLVASPVAVTGSTDDIVNDIQLRFAGGSMDVITPGAMMGGLTDGFPFDSNVDSKRQFLYRAAELGSRGTISRFACRTGPSSGGGAETGFNYTIVLSHGTAPALSATFANNLASPVTVFSGTFDLAAVTAGDWVEIPLTTPFAYNGRDNLVLEISGSGGAAGGFACTSDGTVASTTLYTGRRLFGATSAATTGSVGNTMIDTRFTLQ